VLAVCWRVVESCIAGVLVGVFLLCMVEGLRQEVNPLAALLKLQSLLSVGCSFPQLGHLSCGQGDWLSAQSRHVWSRLWCVSPQRLHL
jgi:hypothetical protein